MITQQPKNSAFIYKSSQLNPEPTGPLVDKWLNQSMDRKPYVNEGFSLTPATLMLSEPYPQDKDERYHLLIHDKA